MAFCGPLLVAGGIVMLIAGLYMLYKNEQSNKGGFATLTPEGVISHAFTFDDGHILYRCVNGACNKPNT